MKKTLLALTIALMSITSYASDELAIREELFNLDQSHYSIRETQKEWIPLPVTCSAPNPLPSGPSNAAKNVTNFFAAWSSNKTFDAVIWREPCPDPSVSLLYMRVYPNGVPFLCSSGFDVIQNGLQYTMKISQSGTTSSFCNDLYVPTTFLVSSYTLPYLNDEGAMTIIYDGVYADYAVNIGAYEPSILKAIEYYHATFNHYFFSSDPADINALDSGKFVGWSRTGKTFNVWSTQSVSRLPVCRFFTEAFAPKSSHFYTASPTECDIVKKNPDWIYEKIAGYVGPTDTNGNCSSGTKLYRLYNNGMSGAPNHRYTTDKSVRDTMVKQGWVSEGYGTDGVISCVAG